MSRPRILTLLLAALLSTVLAVPWAPAAFGDDDDRRSGANAAEAINEKDGKSVFDLAFEVREVSNGVVDQTNSAVAYANCQNCQTVAIAVQIVLVAGMADTVTPTNFAFAVNYECASCTTVAIAYQFVLGGGEPLEFTREGRRELKRVQREFKKLGESGLTVDEIRTRAQALRDRINNLLETQLVPRRGDDDDRPQGDDGRDPDDGEDTQPLPEDEPAPEQPTEPEDPVQEQPAPPTEEAPPPTTTEPAPEDGATPPATP